MAFKVLALFVFCVVAKASVFSQKSVLDLVDRRVQYALPTNARVHLRKLSVGDASSVKNLIHHLPEVTNEADLKALIEKQPKAIRDAITNAVTGLKKLIADKKQQLSAESLDFLRKAHEIQKASLKQTLELFNAQSDAVKANLKSTFPGSSKLLTSPLGQTVLRNVTKTVA